MSDPRPRVLWVTPEVPDLQGGGGAVRQAALLSRLGAELDVDLLVSGRLTDAVVRAAVGSVIEVPVDGRPPPGRARAVWELAVRRRPLFLAAAAGHRRALRRELRARASGYDVVVVHHEELLPLLADVGRALRVLHVFDVKGERAEQTAGVARSARSAQVWRTEATRARAAEARWLPDADLVVACTEDDLLALTRVAGGHLPGVVVPNGVDLAHAGSAAGPGREAVVFLGSLDYEPNLDGITWFVRDVWPRVRAVRPSARLTVAGHRPPAALRALDGDAGVSVIGAVPDAPACLAQHDVVVVPLRIGTGSRLKALEAMAARRPTVGTTVGLEGLDLPTDAGDDGAAPPAVLADGPEDLAGAVVQLLRDPVLASAIGASGRAHVEAAFGWDRLADRLVAVLRSALAEHEAAWTPADESGRSVLVCTRGRPALLETALASVDAALGPLDELVVVEADGAGSATLVGGLTGAARHLAAPRPGKSRQLNLGLRAARHQIVVLTDDDCEVAPGWVEAMAAPFADPAVGVVFGDVVGLSGVRGASAPALVPGAPPAVTWEYANGAAMAVRREAVLGIGGFDERLGPGAPVHGEEHDLVLRLADAGWTARIADAPSVRHLDWRDDAETRHNLVVYSRGAGAFVGAALRRHPRRSVRLLVRRSRYQAGLWRHRGAEGLTFGPVTSAAFVRGLLHGVRLRPLRSRHRARSSPE